MAYKKITILFFSLTVFNVLSIYWIHSLSKSCDSHVTKIWEHFLPKPERFFEVKKRLETLYTELNQQMDLKNDLRIVKVTNQLKELISYFEITSNSFLKQDNSELKLVDVCPDKFPGNKAGYMYFMTGWEIVKCGNNKLMTDVLSIVLNPYLEDINQCPKNIERIIAGLQTNYPNVKIVMPTLINASCSIKLLNSVYQVDVFKNWKTGRVWNELLKHINTPYVFIARDLDYFVGWLSRLDRLIYVISTNPPVKIAGNSIRNRTGHWQVGCYQSVLSNYILRYKDGYYASRNECMFCDYMMGSFMAETEVIQKIGFDEDLPNYVLFEDFFLRVKNSSYLAMNCPDVMDLTSDQFAAKKESDKGLWLPLARKWEINEITLSNGAVLKYTCKEIGFTCANVFSMTKSFLLPLCCRERMVKAFEYFHKFCVRKNIRYTFDGGSVLGMVKLADHLPWDVDGDYMVYTNNVSIFKNAVGEFKKDGYTLHQFEIVDNNKYRTYFKFSAAGEIFSDVSTEEALDHDLYLPEIFKKTPTLARVHGVWLYSPISPGLFARNRYGKEYLQHAQSWVHCKLKDSWQLYKPGIFRKCEKPNHQACLDRYATDGNIQFKY